jgi:hypothetical protein
MCGQFAEAREKIVSPWSYSDGELKICGQRTKAIEGNFILWIYCNKELKMCDVSYHTITLTAQ